MARDLIRLTSQHYRNRLESDYVQLKEEVAAMAKRKGLSPGEQMAMSELKRRKLAMKDQLASMG